MGIIVKSYNHKFDKATCVALGYFDSLHNGHASLISTCINFGFVPSVFTFSNSPYGLLGKVDEQVFTYTERLSRLEQLGAKLCITAEFTQEFMDMSARDFLDKLVSNFNVQIVVIGADYTCGKGAEFNAVDVQRYLENRRISCCIVPLLNSQHGKVASSVIKELINQGDIDAINSLLPMPYSISGKVEHGRKDGAKLLGFPTANISFDKQKKLLKEGVYHTKILLNGKKFLAITNVGNHPTFDDYNYNIESFILDFDESIYDEFITVEFFARLRDTMKFSSVAELIEQIQNDVRRVKECQ